MKTIALLGFSTWFLLLPFTVVASIYLGITAPDKLMAPMLIVLWLFLLIIGQQRISQKHLQFIAVAFIFFFVRNLSKIDDPTVYTSLLWEDAILLGYFCLPILYINTQASITTASKLISINAVVGCLSAFFVALGWLTLPYERFSLSRFDLGIQKSIGLISAYGDLAQLATYFLLLAICVPASLALRKRARGGKLLALFAVTVVTMGLIGNQSRSLLLSLAVASFMASIFYFRSKKNANRMLFNTLFFAIGISVISFVAVTISRITTALGSMGGGQAAQTAAARLEQYEYALSLVKTYPILGVDGAYYAKFGNLIGGIHNMWLSQLARGGLISALLLFWLLLMMFRLSLRLLNDPQTKQYALVTLGYMFALLVSTLFYPADSTLFWALLGMNSAILSTLRSSKPQQ